MSYEKQLELLPFLIFQGEAGVHQTRVSTLIGGVKSFAVTCLDHYWSTS